MENGHLEWICPLKIVIFHSYVSHYQRVDVPISSSFFNLPSNLVNDGIVCRAGTGLLSLPFLLLVCPEHHGDSRLLDVQNCLAIWNIFLKQNPFSWESHSRLWVIFFRRFFINQQFFKAQGRTHFDSTVRGVDVCRVSRQWHSDWSLGSDQDLGGIGTITGNIGNCWFSWNRTGWFFHIGNFIIPSDEVIFFRGVGIPPTR